ncbi:hypothetical protein PRIPAC_71654 [Pristionchus pacificus]|nr:hypothetical protein PRIPAC_71654 [Pristionchus pacificus]
MSAEGGESMTFMQRLKSLFMIQLSILGRYQFGHLFQDVFTEIYPDFPDLEELAAQNSLVFMNSEPLVDFPRPSSVRMIDIGGISVSNAPNQLNNTWSSILDIRPKNVMFLSEVLPKLILCLTITRKL